MHIVDNVSTPQAVVASSSQLAARLPPLPRTARSPPIGHQHAGTRHSGGSCYRNNDIDQHRLELEFLHLVLEQHALRSTDNPVLGIAFRLASVSVAA